MMRSIGSATFRQMATIVSDAGIHCILLNWTQERNDKDAHEQATEILRAVRARNAKIPIFLMASRARGFRERGSRDAGR